MIFHSRSSTKNNSEQYFRSISAVLVVILIGPSEVWFYLAPNTREHIWLAISQILLGRNAKALHEENISKRDVSREGVVFLLFVWGVLMMIVIADTYLEDTEQSSKEGWHRVGVCNQPHQEHTLLQRHKTSLDKPNTFSLSHLHAGAQATAIIARLSGERHCSTPQLSPSLYYHATKSSY